MSRKVNEDPLNLQSARTSARSLDKALSKSAKEPLPSSTTTSPTMGIDEPTSRLGPKSRKHEHNTRSSSKAPPRPASQSGADPEESEPDTPREKDQSFTFPDTTNEPSSSKGKLRAVEPREQSLENYQLSWMNKFTMEDLLAYLSQQDKELHAALFQPLHEKDDWTVPTLGTLGLDELTLQSSALRTLANRLYYDLIWAQKKGT